MMTAGARTSTPMTSSSSTARIARSANSTESGYSERSDMTWGDSEMGLPQIKTTLALLREGKNEFQELTATGDDAELVDKISKLGQNLLRSIVFERVMAARYQPREEA